MREQRQKLQAQAHGASTFGDNSFGDQITSSQKNVDFLIEQLAGAGKVSAKKMFGEHGIYCGDKMVALFCNDQLYVKPTDQGKAFAGKLPEAAPYPGAKPCLLIDGERWDDHEWLAQLVRITAAHLPAPKKKAPKQK